MDERKVEKIVTIPDGGATKSQNKPKDPKTILPKVPPKEPPKVKPSGGGGGKK